MNVVNPSWGIHCRIGRPAPDTRTPEEYQDYRRTGRRYIVTYETHYPHCALDACNCPCHIQNRPTRDAWTFSAHRMTARLNDAPPDEVIPVDPAWLDELDGYEAPINDDTPIACNQRYDEERSAGR